jgi:hypothetical protein
LREDDDVVVRGSVEVAQHIAPGAFNVVRHGPRGRVGGVWVPEDARAQHIEVLLQLRLAVERTAGVVEVDVALVVQPTIFGCAQLVQRGGCAVAGVSRHEIRVRFVAVESHGRGQAHRVHVATFPVHGAHPPSGGSRAAHSNAARLPAPHGQWAEAATVTSGCVASNKKARP